MIDEPTMRRAMQAYIDAFNESDLDALVGLYSHDATIEDPVGTDPICGHEAIEAFYRESLQTGARLRLSAPIRASHGNAAAMAFDVYLDMPDGPSIIHVIDVMRFDDDGRVKTMHAYWGPGDLEHRE